MNNVHFWNTNVELIYVKVPKLVFVSQSSCSKPCIHQNVLRDNKVALWHSAEATIVDETAVTLIMHEETRVNLLKHTVLLLPSRISYRISGWMHLAVTIKHHTGNALWRSWNEKYSNSRILVSSLVIIIIVIALTNSAHGIFKKPVYNWSGISLL